jgi:cation-transporting ATPase 13A3/4/5
VWFYIRFKRARVFTLPPKAIQMSSLSSLTEPLTKADGLTAVSISDENDVKKVGVKMVGFTPHGFGMLSWCLCSCLGLLVAVAYVISLYGVYYDCQFVFPEALCVVGDFRIMGDYEASIKMQFAITMAMLVVYGTSIFFSRKRLHMFESVCELKDAKLVKVSKTTTYQQSKNTSTKDPPIFFLAPILRCYNKCFRQNADLVSKYKETCKVEIDRFGSRYITFQCERYVWSEPFQTFETKGVDAFRSRAVRTGLSSHDAAERMSLVGPNLIKFKVQGLHRTIVGEFASFLYLYQLLMYSWWIYNTYWQVASVFVLIVLVSGLGKALVKHRAEQQIYNMTRMNQTVTVLRDGEWKILDASSLVPGDVVRLSTELTPNGWKIPADMALVSGHVVCNESGLTGEPMPVHKTQIQQMPKSTKRPNAKDAVRRNSNTDMLRVRNSWAAGDRGKETNLAPNQEVPKYNINPDHMLFAGCTVSQVGKNNELKSDLPSGLQEAHALVLRTGITTARGELIQEILYALPISYQWDMDLGPVFAMLFVVGCIYGVSGVAMQLNNGSDIPTWITSFDTFMWSMSQMISPAIPLALIVGQIASTDRLKKQTRIGVKDPNRIAMAGKVQTMCFDKTGTITKDGLDFTGVHNKDSPVSESFVSDASLINQKILYGLATCHSLATFGSQFVGHQVEVEMFKASGFTLSNVGNKTVAKKGTCELHVQTHFKFDHHHMTMSVIVEDVGTKTVFAYVKGAPENVLKACKAATIPKGMGQVVAQYALQGYYVLALARKPYSMKQAQNRNAVESGLNFLGLLLFRNEMKPDSPHVFDELKNADIECIMITGDNAMCGAYIGRQCGIVSKETDVFLADIGPSEDFMWTNLSDPNPNPAKKLSTANTIALAQSGKASIALTGNSFEFLCKKKQMGKYLELVKVYSRMSPDNKQMLVDMLMESGRIVGMCGDGGNDCGALRAAHMGLALSNSDASIVAPFTTTDKSLMSVVNLLREGRCALANSFASYKFLILYGQVFGLVKVLGQLWGCLISALGYFVIDGAMVIGLSSAISNSNPNLHLGKKTPTASLLSADNVISILQFHVVSLITFVATMVMLVNDPGYMAHPVKYTSAWQFWLLTDSYEQALMFTIFGIRMCAAGIAFSLGGSFRASILQNWSMLYLVVLFYACFSFLWLSDENYVTRCFHMASENFNRPDTDRYTWIIYHDEDPSSKPSSSGGISIATRVVIWLVLSLSGPVSVFLEHVRVR